MALNLNDYIFGPRRPASCITSCCKQQQPDDDGDVYVNRQDRRPIEFLETVFQALPHEEKRRVHNELYGMMIEDREECPRFLREKLDEMEMELGRIRNNDKKAFLQAIRAEEENNVYNHNHHPNDDDDSSAWLYEYVSDEEFRLMFLRADEYHAPRAAKRLTLYMEEKLRLFGRDRLVRKITQRDLSDEDLEALRSGKIVVPGVTDHFGRLIVLQKRCIIAGVDPTNFRRAMFYLLVGHLANNPSFQRKGLVFIGLNFASKRSIMVVTKRRKRVFGLLRFFSNVLPFRIASSHMCYDDLREHILLNLFLVVLPKKIIARIQCHYRKYYEEIRFDLMKYGIDVDVLPLTSEGEYRYDLILENLERNRLEEEKRLEHKISDAKDETWMFPEKEEELEDESNVEEEKKSSSI